MCPCSVRTNLSIFIFIIPKWPTLISVGCHSNLCDTDIHMINEGWWSSHVSFYYLQKLVFVMHKSYPIAFVRPITSAGSTPTTRWDIGHMAYRVELEYRLFLSIDSSLYRPKTIFFRGCAKFRPLAFFKIQYGRRHTQISLNPNYL